MKRNQSFYVLILALIIATTLSSCKKKEPDATIVPPPTSAVCAPDTVFHPTGSGARLVFKFIFDSTQIRLDNVGNPAAIPAGNAAQSPKFNFMSQHYIELANTFDSLGKGKVLYVGVSTTDGGAKAIDYCSSTNTKNGVTFYSVPLSSLGAGTYSWLRISLAYQNYNITYMANAIPGNHLGTGTIASFIGYNTYIKNYVMNDSTYVPSTSVGGAGNHLQGYWGFETTVLGTKYFADGQAPAGATTVPNPIFATSPIPAGSCVVTGQFVNASHTTTPLVITGNETSDIVITVSLSINKSFEWHEVNADGFYQPEIGENVVNMGIRGLIPIIN